MNNIATTTINVTSDTFVYAASVNSNYEGWHLECSGGTSDEESFLLNFDLSSLAGKTITAATLYLSVVEFDGTATIAFKRITSSWNAATVTYATKPTIDSTTYGQTTLPNTAAGYKSFNVTSLIQNIVGGATYYGIWGYSVYEDYWGQFESNADTNIPYLSVTYTDSNTPYTANCPVIGTCSCDANVPTKVNNKTNNAVLINTSGNVAYPVVHNANNKTAVLVNSNANCITPTLTNAKICTAVSMSVSALLLAPSKINLKVISVTVSTASLASVNPTVMNNNTITVPNINTDVVLNTPYTTINYVATVPNINTDVNLNTSNVKIYVSVTVSTASLTSVNPSVLNNNTIAVPNINTNAVLNTTGLKNTLIATVISATGSTAIPTVVNNNSVIVNTMTTELIANGVTFKIKLAALEAINTNVSMNYPDVHTSISSTQVVDAVVNTSCTINSNINICTIKSVVKIDTSITGATPRCKINFNVPNAINTNCNIVNLEPPDLILAPVINTIARAKEVTVLTPHGVRVFKLYNYATTTETTVAVNNWQISDRINEIPVMSCTITDLNGATLQNGLSIRLYLDNVKIWEGIISKSRKVEELTGYLFYAIEARGNSSIGNRKLVVGSYDSKTTGYIVTDIFNNYLSPLGVTIGNIETGVVMTKCVFNYVKLVDALNMLRDQTGFNWWIDKDKKLYWVAQSTYTAPFTLDNTVQHSGFTQEQSMEEYRNVQYVRGGLGVTDLQTQEVLQKPDGQRKTYTTRFPIAKQQDMILETKIGAGAWTAVPNTDIGVNGLDTNKKWYWSFNSTTLSQDTAETALTSSDNIRLTYYGLVRIFIMSDSTTKISERQAIEGGTGEYENIQVEESIEDVGQAIEFADGLITTYGDIKDTIGFTTEVAGLQAGQLLTVNKSLFGINSSFLISGVTMQAVDPNTISYSVTALDGVAVGGWEDYFRKLHKKAQDFQIGADEAITNLRTINDVYNHAGSIAIGITTTNLYPKASTYTVLFPNDSTSDWTNEGNVSISTSGTDIALTIINSESYGGNARYTLSGSTNMSTAVLIEFWMKIENPESLTNSNDIEFQSSSGNFYYKLFNKPNDSEWHKYTYVLADFVSHNSPDWSAITSIGFYLEDNGNGTTAAAVAHFKDFVFYTSKGRRPYSGLYPAHGAGGSLENVND